VVATDAEVTPLPLWLSPLLPVAAKPCRLFRQVISDGLWWQRSYQRL